LFNFVEKKNEDNHVVFLIDFF